MTNTKLIKPLSATWHSWIVVRRAIAGGRSKFDQKVGRWRMQKSMDLCQTIGWRSLLGLASKVFLIWQRNSCFANHFLQIFAAIVFHILKWMQNHCWWNFGWPPHSPRKESMIKYCNQNYLKRERKPICFIGASEQWLDEVFWPGISKLRAMRGESPDDS